MTRKPYPRAYVVTSRNGPAYGTHTVSAISHLDAARQAWRGAKVATVREMLSKNERHYEHVDDEWRPVERIDERWMS